MIHKFNCDYCGKYVEDENKTRFCSERCNQRYHEERRPKRYYKNICANCGKEYVGTRLQHEGELKFCSTDCRWDYADKHRTPRNCVICGKEFMSLKSNHVCCSKDCKTMNVNIKKERVCVVCGKKYHTYYANVKTCSDECCGILRSENTIKNIHEGVYKATMTKPHVKVLDMLKNCGIDYEPEKKSGRYSMDIYLPKYNLFIEIMGGFFHCDVRRHIDPSDSKITNGIVEKDRKKKEDVEKRENTKILYLWEKDIDESPELVSCLIDEFIKTPLALMSYHSSSYVYNNLSGLLYNEYADLQLMESTMND